MISFLTAHNMRLSGSSFQTSPKSPTATSDTQIPTGGLVGITVLEGRK